MISQTKTASFKEFLGIAPGSKEVSLAIAKNNKEIQDFSRSLDEAGFEQAEEVFNLFKLPKAYMTISEDMDKNVYDFIVQYPTGQVEIFDKERMRSEMLSPDYSRSVVLLVEKGALNKLQAKGFDLLAAVGPAYQT